MSTERDFRYYPRSPEELTHPGLRAAIAQLQAEGLAFLCYQVREYIHDAPTADLHEVVTVPSLERLAITVDREVGWYRSTGAIEDDFSRWLHGHLERV